MAKKVKNRKRVMSVRNEQGIKVKRFCASCKDKFYNERGCRICNLRQLKVRPREVCKDWTMAQCLQQAGLRPGKVKCKEYLKFVQKVRSEEKVLLEEKRISLKQCKTAEQLRTEFGKNIYAIK